MLILLHVHINITSSLDSSAEADVKSGDISPSPAGGALPKELNIVIYVFDFSG